MLVSCAMGLLAPSSNGAVRTQFVWFTAKATAAPSVVPSTAVPPIVAPSVAAKEMGSSVAAEETTYALLLAGTYLLELIGPLALAAVTTMLSITYTVTSKR